MAADSYVQAGLDAGLSPDLANYMPRFVQVESGGNPSAQTGSYSGLLQMGPDEAQRYGGNGLGAGAKMYADRANWFQGKFGRAPSPTELYLTNQQGEGGITQHLSNPDAPAWQNMLATGEGQKKGAGWARQAIWGNVPDDMKPMFGSVDNITSKQFVNDIWGHKIERTPLNPSTAMAYNGNGSDQSQSPIHQALAKQMNGAPSMADNGILSAVQNYGPGALFGAGRADYDPSMGLMGLGAGLTVAGGDAKGGSGMMNAAMLPMFKQNFSMTTDALGRQVLYNHRTGAMYNTSGQLLNGGNPGTGPGGAAGGVGSDGTPMDRTTAIAQSPLAMKNQAELDQKSSREKFDKLDASANDAQGMIDELQKAKRLSQDPSVSQGGFTAELLDHAKSAAAGLGINLPGAAQTAELDKIHGDIMGKYLSTLNGMTRIAGPELKFGSMSTPGLDKPAATNQNIYDNMIENLQRGIAARDLARQHISQYGVLGPRYSQELQAQQDKNPVYSDTTVQASPPKGSGNRPPLSSFSK